MKRVLTELKLVMARIVCKVMPERGRSVLRNAARKELQRVFGDCPHDMCHVGARWIAAATGIQQFVWRWDEDQLNVCVTDCLFARRLGENAKVFCDEDQNFLNRLVSVEKTSRIAYGQTKCRIVLRDR